jgi:hypothetical protein
LRPRPGAIVQTASKRCSEKRVRHKITVLRLIDNCSEIATSECPWALLIRSGNASYASGQVHSFGASWIVLNSVHG